jgi:hypothetical protein
MHLPHGLFPTHFQGEFCTLAGSVNRLASDRRRRYRRSRESAAQTKRLIGGGGIAGAVNQPRKPSV